jgi:hypothetical protein
LPSRQRFRPVPKLRKQAQGLGQSLRFVVVKSGGLQWIFSLNVVDRYADASAWVMVIRSAR